MGMDEWEGARMVARHVETQAWAASPSHAGEGQRGKWCKHTCTRMCRHTQKHTPAHNRAPKKKREEKEKLPGAALPMPRCSAALSNPLHSLLSFHRRCKDTIVLTVLQPHQVSIMRHSVAFISRSPRITLLQS